MAVSCGTNSKRSIFILATADDHGGGRAGIGREIDRRRDLGAWNLHIEAAIGREPRPAGTANFPRRDADRNPVRRHYPDRAEFTRNEGSADEAQHQTTAGAVSFQFHSRQIAGRGDSTPTSAEGWTELMPTALGLAACEAHRFEMAELIEGLQACLKANIQLVTTQLAPKLILSQLLIKISTRTSAYK